jgi:hypothetical protein
MSEEIAAEVISINHALLKSLGIDGTGVTTFAEMIEELVWLHDIPYMEAVILYCDKTGMEVEVAGDLVKSSPLKDKIKTEAENLFYLPKSSRLPI